MPGAGRWPDQSARAPAPATTPRASDARHRRELLKNITTLQAKVGGEFERRLRLLQRLGYVTEDAELTADGRWAREIRHPSELVVCELLRRQMAVTANPETFAALLAALTTERPPRRLIGHPTLLGLAELIRDLQRLEQQHAFRRHSSAPFYRR